MEFIKSRLPKTYKAQWSLSGALLINLIVESLTYAFARFVKSDVELRMILESSYDRFYICAIIFFGSWLALILLRNTADLPIALGVFNIHVMSSIYIQGQICEMEDPDRAHTYHLSLFLIMDGISNFLQCVSILELTVMSNVLWCWFGKLPLLAFLMINYSDRRPIIM